MNKVKANPWRTTPRKTILIFLAAVFFVFAAIGFASDVMNMGRQSVEKLAISVVLTGLFAVCYAFGGITLRNRFWMAFLPIFAAQFLIISLWQRYSPDPPPPPESAEMQQLHQRLHSDGIFTVVAICLGYAGFVWASIGEGRRYGQTRAEMAALESELEAARHVQEVILPNPDQSHPGFRVESVYKPALQVGGDFFQVVPIANDGLLIVFGDVAGKGLPAAMLVSLLVGSIRTVAEFTDEPSLILSKLHDRLVDRTSAGFSTALAARITKDGNVTMASAGQLSPYLDGSEIELPGALPLGVSGGGNYAPVRLQLHPGSRLTFLSDGVVEAMNEKGELFGFERSAKMSMESAARIAATAVDFGQSDDITVLTVERMAS